MGTRERRKREAAARRKSILDAAKKLFGSNGYEKTTIPKIAEACELAPGTIYLYFPSKDSLYAELLFEGYAILEDMLRTAVAKKKKVRDQAATLIDTMFQFAREYSEYFEIIFFVLKRDGHASWEDRFPAEQIARLETQRMACTQVAADVLAETGWAKTPKKLQAAMEAIWSMLSGTAYFFHDDEAFTKIAAESKALLVAAIFGK